MKSKLPILLFLLTVSYLTSTGQQLTLDNIYQVNKFALSPAYAGYTDNWETFMTFRQQWVGVPGAPRKQVLSTNSPFKKGMGLGVTINSEQTGNFTRFYASFAYSYKVELDKKQGIYFGIAPEIYRNQLDRTNIKGDIDPAYNVDLVGSAVDVAFGAMYYKEHLNVGLVAPRLLGMRVKYDKEQNLNYTLIRHFAMHASYAYDIEKKKWQLRPTLVIRTNQHLQLMYELSAVVSYKQMFWSGLTFRKGSSVGFNTGVSFSDKMVLNYNYEYGFSGISALSSGSHEITMGFLLKRSKQKKPPITAFRMPFPDEMMGGGVGEDTVLRRKVDSIVAVVTKVEIDKNAIALQVNNHETRITKTEKRLDSLINAKPTTVTPPSNEPVWGAPLILNVEFGNNSDKIFASSYPVLNKLASELMRNPQKLVKITGHTDNVGSDRYNERLSEKRAEAIKQYLVDNRKIDADRIMIAGKGPSEPRDTNDTPAGRSRNRRIEAQFADK